jgi:hypothetical protein
LIDSMWSALYTDLLCLADTRLWCWRSDRWRRLDTSLSSNVNILCLLHWSRIRWGRQIERLSTLVERYLTVNRDLLSLMNRLGRMRCGERGR